MTNTTHPQSTLANTEKAPVVDSTGRPPRADGADIIRDLRRQLVQEHEAAEWRQTCIDEAIAAIHDAPQEIAPLLPPVAPADLPRAVRALIDRARSQLVEALVRAETERDEALGRLRTLIDEVWQHLGQDDCPSYGHCLGRIRDRAHALAAMDPETPPRMDLIIGLSQRGVPQHPAGLEAAALAEIDRLRDQWRTLATLVEPLGILDADSNDPATLTDRICRWISDLREDSAYQARVLGERQQEIDQLRAEAAMLRARVREWEAVNADLAERCDSGDIPIRLGERYSLAVLREIDRLRTERDRLMEELPEDNTIVAAIRRLRTALGSTPDTGSTDG